MPKAGTSRKGLIVGVGVLLISLLGIAVSVPQMATKLSDRNVSRVITWFGKPIRADSFSYRGESFLLRAVREPTKEDLEAVNDELERRDLARSGYLEITFRGQIARFPLSPEDDERLPNEIAHDRWFRLMPMAMVKGLNSQRDLQERFDSGEVMPHVIAVARYPAEGFHPESWGLVRRKDWPYLFAEFRHGGPAEESVAVSRLTYGELDSLYAPGPYADAVVFSEDEKQAAIAAGADAEDLLVVDEEEYKAGRWRLGAMHQVTPATLIRAKSKTVDDGIRSMGWTWPIASLSVMGVLVGVGLIGASRVSRS
ncbi:MAG: hypothetical protein AAGB34_07415 [Planctomycetota bacterium]